MLLIRIASATSAATASPTETQPIGFSETQSLSASATGGSNNNGATALLFGSNALISLGCSVLTALIGGLFTLL